MPFLDSVIPTSVDPTIRTVINVLVGVHLLAFLLYIYLLVRSSKKTSADAFREQYKTLEQKQKIKKQE
jgi:hypothetical protein